jgi:hypothetical protein
MARWKTALACFAALALAPATAPAQGGARDLPVDLKLALGIDISRSVDAEEARLQRDGYVQAFRHPRVHAAVRSGMLGRIAVAYYEWSGFQQNMVADWTIIGDAASATRFAEMLATTEPNYGTRTGISAAIDFGTALLDKPGIEGIRRVIDLSGDGPNNWGELVNLARDRAVAKRITINGLPIMNDRPSFSGRPPLANLDLYYRDCVIGGPRAFLIVANNFEDFARAVLRKLILEIAGLHPVTDAKHALLQGLEPPPAIAARWAGSRVAAGPGTAEPRVAPPCDAGERQRRRWWGDQGDDWTR